MKTLALIIGNNEYHENAKLTNAVNDARAIKDAFEKLEFDVIYRENCNVANASELLDEFSNRIKNYDASIFYFAGHGFEFDGENYLTTIECQIPPSGKHMCSWTSIALSEILRIYKDNTNKVNIAIIDACRKNMGRGSNNGLAPVNAPQGTLIAFSTSPNEGASDSGYGNNSIYTGALISYIGRENLSVEELFKKVRKTVYSLSNGKQTTWEHTSLINDYYFNIGQKIYSKDIPYSEDVIKDINYKETDDFGELIEKVKSYNWNIQGPAIKKLLRFPVSDLNKNQQFILGRNLLQASGVEFSAQNFMRDISLNISKYNVEGINHLLNGILFEVYFDSHGEFRKEKRKTYFLEEVLSLRKNTKHEKSFTFIRELILSYDDGLIYLPQKDDKDIDIDVVVEEVKKSHDVYLKETIQVIKSITFNGLDIMKYLKKYSKKSLNKQKLSLIIADIFTAPLELIKINSNLELTNVELFEKNPLYDMDEI